MRDRRRSTLVTIAVFAMMGAVLSTFIGSMISHRERLVADALSMTTAQLQERLSDHITLETEADGLRFLDVAMRSWQGDISADVIDLPASFIGSIFPFVLLLIAGHMLISCVAFVTFLIVLSRPATSRMSVVHALPMMLVRYVGLFLWISVRSFAWIPFIGPIICLWYAPRFLRAPGMLVSGTGILQAVQLSLMKTRGAWWAMLLRLVFLVFSVLMLTWMSLMISGSIAIVSPKIGALAFLFLWQAVSAYHAAFLLEVA